jgi:alkylhydroperoxidase family enzyme
VSATSALAVEHERDAPELGRGRVGLREGRSPTRAAGPSLPPPSPDGVYAAGWRTSQTCATAPARLTDEDVAALEAAGLSEDEIFEQTVAIAR